MREGIELFRRLAADRPRAFQDGLATSLYSLGNLLRELDRTDEALEALEEAVAIWRDLASWRPVFNTRLAAGLDGLGETFTALGWNERAVETLCEVVEIGRRLDQEQPGVHRDVLALSLHHLSLGLREMGDFREAVDRSEEAIRLLLPLAESCPEAHGDTLEEMRREYSKTATVAGVEPAPELLLQSGES